MNKDYIIRKAIYEDVDNIMNFIKNYWSDTHILANHKDIFEYEHRYGNDINFIIAEDIHTSEIKAILGFIAYGKISSDIMTVMWKSNDKKNPFLGVEILEYLLDNVEKRIVSSCGIRIKTIGIYKYLGFYTGRLDHYYRISPRAKYEIAQIEDNVRIPCSLEREYEFVHIKSFKDLERLFDFEVYKNRRPKPYKEPWYIEKRYYNYPIYTYNVIGIRNRQGLIQSILFTREVECNGAKILRIIDFIGNVEDLRYISYEIDNLLKIRDYEYVDFYQHGISNEIMRQAGFTMKSLTNNIIPNYFEPFANKNIELNYFTTDDDNFLMFKGDADQDRPNFYRRKNI